MWELLIGEFSLSEIFDWLFFNSDGVLLQNRFEVVDKVM